MEVQATFQDPLGKRTATLVMLLLFVAGAAVFFVGSALLAKRIGQHGPDDIVLYPLVIFGFVMFFFCLYELFMLAFRVQEIRVRESELDVMFAAGRGFTLPRNAARKCFSGFVFALNAIGGQKCTAYLAQGRILVIGDSMPNYKEISSLLSERHTGGAESLL